MVRGKHVVYLALQPTPEAAVEALARLDALPQRRRMSAKPTAPNRVHVSLAGIGDFKRPPTPVFEKVMEAIADVAVAPFVVEFNRIATWGGADPPCVVLWGDEGVIGVHALFSEIHKALWRADMAPRREPEFTPHMTLIYDRTEVPETPVEPVRWTATEVVLIHSVHGEGRHEVMGRLPLTA
ncbi:2'-5' RNA ligase family protein [Phenylobacterium sp.]|uniref:2'-5' RNA ligase family protein n=1 Tax=Phenylobacterium sp. TaxID=1871053 RepID=UPI0025F3E83B|nr:2'-5' RNA ligase family protein [Phenylobacterium sp.]